MPRLSAILVNLLVWPGFGHFALGRFARGSIWIAIGVASFLLSPLHMLLPLGAVIAGRVLSAVDAGLVRARPLPQAGPFLLRVVSAVVALGLMIMLTRIYYVEAFKIPAGGMIPTLQIGDHLFVNKLAYRAGAPERGDVIVFVNPCMPDRDYVSRVVALGGDTVELRCDILYVNGVAARVLAEVGDCRYWDRDFRDSWEEQQCSRYVETLGAVEHDIVYTPDRPERDRERSKAAPDDYTGVAGEHDFPGEELPGCEGMSGAAAAGRPPGRIEESAPENGRYMGACRPQRRYRIPDGHIFTMGDNRDNSSDSRAWGPVPVDHVKGRVIGIWWSTGHDREIRWDRMDHIR